MNNYVLKKMNCLLVLLHPPGQYYPPDF